jgi:uncharacterized membrane protein
MLLQLTAGSLWWVHAAAVLALSLHIGGGIAGILSGTAAAVFRKGGRLHRLAGDVFVVSMLTMAGFGAVMATLLLQWSNVMGGAFTLYLVGSAWMTARRRNGGVGGFEVGAMLVGLCIAAGALVVAWVGAHRPDGMIDGNPWQPAVVFAVVATLAVAMDLRVILQGGISGVARIARHLWRMCLGLFIAAGSFFLGQQQVMPAFIQGSALLYVPAVAPLLLLIFWLVRVRVGSRFRMQMVSAGAA